MTVQSITFRQLRRQFKKSNWMSINMDAANGVHRYISLARNE